MNARRLVVAAAAVLLPVSALAVAGVTDSDDTSLSSGHASAALSSKNISVKKSLRGARKARNVKVRALPPVVQPGKKVRSPNKARVALVTNVKPKRVTVVTLQARTNNGWKTLRSASTAPNGRHVFKAALKRGGQAATYRVRVKNRASKPTSTQRWLTPTFTEAFNGRRLSKAWSHRGTEYGGVNRMCSKGDPRATVVRGGTVRLRVIKDPNRKKKCNALREGVSTGRYAYRLNGHIGTQESFTFRYGVAAARVKFPRQAGQHAAFWLQVDSPDFTKGVNARHNGGEMDVIESYGANQGELNSLGLTTGVHRYTKVRPTPVTQAQGGWVRNARQYLAGPKDSYHGRFHVFSVEWTPKYYIYRIDGQEYWRTHRGISGRPSFPVLSNLSSDYEIHRLKGGDKSLPQTMQVDWLRVWETGN